MSLEFLQEKVHNAQNYFSSKLNYKFKTNISILITF